MSAASDSQLDCGAAGGAPAGLIERDLELAALAALLDGALNGDGGVLLIEGPAGIGKSALLAAAGDRARGEGMLVLSGRGGELEREFGLGIVRQLFERTLATVSGPRRRWTPFCCEDGTYTWTISYKGTPVYETSGIYWLSLTLKPTPEHKSIIVERGAAFQLPITIKEADEDVLSAAAIWSGGGSASMPLEFTQ